MKILQVHSFQDPNMKLFLVFCVLVVTGAANPMECPPCECHCHFNINEQTPEQTTTYWPDYTTTTTGYGNNCRAGAEPCTNGDQCCSGNCTPSDQGNVCAPGKKKINILYYKDGFMIKETTIFAYSFQCRVAVCGNRG